MTTETTTDIPIPEAIAPAMWIKCPYSSERGPMIGMQTLVAPLYLNRS